MTENVSLYRLIIDKEMWSEVIVEFTPYTTYVMKKVLFTTLVKTLTITDGGITNF